MFTSADLLLIEVAGVFMPALIVSVFAVVFSYRITMRYNKAMSRLYKMSFKGVDTERKRIAGELHDHLALHSITMSLEFESLKNRLEGEDLASLKKIESNYDLFRHKTHQIVEFMYPKGLLDSDWKSALEHLAEKLSIGGIQVSFESFADKTPSHDWLHHTFWAIQELVTNAIRHSKVNRVQITATGDEDFFVIGVHYRATDLAKKWANAKSKSGLGLLIIQDRLKIVQGSMRFDITDDVVTHSILLKYEGVNS